MADTVEVHLQEIEDAATDISDNYGDDGKYVYDRAWDIKGQVAKIRDKTRDQTGGGNQKRLYRVELHLDSAMEGDTEIQKLELANKDAAKLHAFLRRTLKADNGHVLVQVGKKVRKYEVAVDDVAVYEA